MSNRYPLNVEWSEEDQEYIATCPAFPGLSAFGASEEEAVREAKIALTGFIETYEAHNMPLPDAASRSSFSGKLQLRLEKSLHRLAAQMANNEDVSLNTFIVDAVQAKVTGTQVANRTLNEIRMLMASNFTVRPVSTRYTKTVEQVSIDQTTVTNGERRKDN